MKVLVVEDCKLTIDFVSYLVGENLTGVELHIVSTRKDALEVLESRNDFNLVFLDWNLPDGDTKWLVHVVRSTQSKLIRVIWISAEENFRINTQIHIEWADDECEKIWIADFIWKISEANEDSSNSNKILWEELQK